MAHRIVTKPQIPDVVMYPRHERWGFSAGRANGLAARTVDALPDWGAAY